MEYVYASLLLYHAGKEINEESVKKILEAAGIQVDDVRVKALVAALKEVNIEEAIKTAALPVAVGGQLPPLLPHKHLQSKRKKRRKKKRKRKSRRKQSRKDLLASLASRRNKCLYISTTLSRFTAELCLFQPYSMQVTKTTKHGK